MATEKHVDHLHQAQTSLSHCDAAGLQDNTSSQAKPTPPSPGGLHFPQGLQTLSKSKFIIIINS